MGIQQCAECHANLKWTFIIKSIWLGYKPIQCHQCGKQHKVSFKTRYKTTISMIIPLFLLAMIVTRVFDLSTIQSLGSMVLGVVLITFILPFCIKYTTEPVD